MMPIEPLLPGEYILGIILMLFCGWYIITHWNDVFPK